MSEEPEKTAALEALREALIEGERSGDPQTFDIEAFLAERHAASER